MADRITPSTPQLDAIHLEDTLFVIRGVNEGPEQSMAYFPLVKIFFPQFSWRPLKVKVDKKIRVEVWRVWASEVPREVAYGQWA